MPAFTVPHPSLLLRLLPFTCQGTILIAVNPLRNVPNPEMSEYMDRSLNPETPHPYAIAEVRAFGQIVVR